MAGASAVKLGGGGHSIGVEVGPDALRAVRLTAWRARGLAVAEARWAREDPASLANAVDAIRLVLGPARRVAVALDLDLLLTKRLRLPPVPAVERQRIVAMEPDRYFAVRPGDELLVDASEASGIVFAAKDREVSEIAGALAALGPVELIEPAPCSLARALAHHGIREARLLLARSAGAVGYIEVSALAVRSARRIRGDLAEALEMIGDGQAAHPIYVDPWDSTRQAGNGTSRPGSNPIAPLPSVDGAGAAFLGALGAALGLDGESRRALMPDEPARASAARRRRSAARAAITLVAAIAFSIVSAIGSRARVDASLDDRIQSLRARATAVSALQEEAAALERQRSATAALEARRADPLEVLSVISGALPPDVHVRSLTWSGESEWRIEGRAGNAARLVPLFEAHPRFEAVRFLEATRRGTSRGRAYESFSLAFKLVPSA